MTTQEAGKPGKKANPGRYVPRHYVRRVARFLVLRATVRQCQPLKAPALLPRAVLSLPGKPASSASEPLKTEGKTGSAFAGAAAQVQGGAA